MIEWTGEEESIIGCIVLVAAILAERKARPQRTVSFSVYSFSFHD